MNVIAKDRAMLLLESWLDDEQRAKLATAGGFAFEADNGRTYVLLADDRANGYVYDPDAHIAYGWYPADQRLPRPDLMLATMLSMMVPDGAATMLLQACNWPYGASRSWPVYNAWRTVDAVAGVTRRGAGPSTDWPYLDMGRY